MRKVLNALLKTTSVFLVCALGVASARASRTGSFEIISQLAHQAWFESGELAHDGSELGPPYLKRVAAQALPQIPIEGDLEILKTALNRQLEICQGQDGSATWNFDGQKVSRKTWCLETARAFLKLADETGSFASLYERAKSEFDWYRSIGNDGRGQVVFTGYYRPLLQASRQATSVYRYPIYSRPADLVQVVVGGKQVWRKRNADGSLEDYPTRKMIDSDGALRGKGLELAYADNLFDVFVLQVQGSGVLELHGTGQPTERMIVNYAAQNGRPYTSLRRVLREKGVAEEYLTIQGMRKYFALHPEDFIPTLNANESYVFFEKSESGPFGAAGVILSSGHSIAVDQGVFPMGALTLMRATRPSVDSQGEMTGWQDFARFAVTQDTGGAIKGPGRVDIYWGEGAYPELAAGQMNQAGELFFPLVRH